jgi:hypothetical protein
MQCISGLDATRQLVPRAFCEADTHAYTVSTRIYRKENGNQQDNRLHQYRYRFLLILAKTLVQTKPD